MISPLDLMVETIYTNAVRVTDMKTGNQVVCTDFNSAWKNMQKAIASLEAMRDSKKADFGGLPG